MEAKCCGTCGMSECSGDSHSPDYWECRYTGKEIENIFEIKSCFQEYISYGYGHSCCKNCYIYNTCSYKHKNKSPEHYCGAWKQGFIGNS